MPEHTGLMVSRFYEMDPEMDDLIGGPDLREGMVVLLEDELMRGDPERIAENAYEMSRCREVNQWCEVTQLSTRTRTGYAPLIRFVGVYPDGVKRTRTYDSSYSWLVKRFSVDGAA